uniref:Intraflagellar transport protein 81 homolog n=1 Tax=Mesocestoides corti TaxID=53468 RepID=A0A5K3EP99_MESCO
MCEIFWSRFEEKIDEKLTACGEDIENSEDVDFIRNVNKKHWDSLCCQMTKLTDLACEVGSVQRDLFALRAQLQKDLLARLGKVLAREAMALSARTATLERQINTHLLQPSQKATGLRSTYERLTKEKSALSDSVSKLNSLLEIYTASEQQYLQLATQKADAQRQMAFIRQLQQTSPSLRRRSLSESDSHTENTERQKQTFFYTNL